MIIATLLLVCLGCSTPQKKIKYLSLPTKYLKCEELPEFTPSQSAINNANGGDFKLFTIELVEDKVNIILPWHNKCVINAKSAIEYQSRMNEQ